MSRGEPFLCLVVVLPFIAQQVRNLWPACCGFKSNVQLSILSLGPEPQLLLGCMTLALLSAVFIHTFVHGERAGGVQGTV